MAESGAGIPWGEYSRAFAAQRLDDAGHIDEWLRRFIERGRIERGMTVADVGCGVGRYALPLAERAGVNVVAVDASAEMLAALAARRTTQPVRAIHACAEALPLAEQSVDAALLSMSLHQFDDPQRSLREVFRVLRCGGRLILRTTTQGQINRMETLEYRYFPAARRIDRQRMPSMGALAAMLNRAGFGRIDVHHVRESTARRGGEWIAQFAARPCSTLHLIREQEFVSGLERMRGEIDPDHVYEDVTYFVLVIAARPGR